METPMSPGLPGVRVLAPVGQGTGRILGYITQSVLAPNLRDGTLRNLYAVHRHRKRGQHLLAVRSGQRRGALGRPLPGAGRRCEDARHDHPVLSGSRSLSAFSLRARSFWDQASLPARSDEPGLERVLRVFAFALPFFALMSILVWATQGFQTVTYATYNQQILRPLIYFGLVVGVYLLGASLTGVAVAYAVSMSIGVLIGLYYLRMLFPPLLDRGVQPKFETKALFAVLVADERLPRNAVRQQLERGARAGTLSNPPATVALFQAAFRTATLATLVRFAFNGIFSPIISSLPLPRDGRRPRTALQRRGPLDLYRGVRVVPRDRPGSPPRY